MSVHGRSFFQYYNETQINHFWDEINVGDLQRVELEDSVYSPAKLHVVISNPNMNRKLSSDVDVAAGT